MSGSATVWRRGGRYPRGYGLPSLVVVLFLVSVLVSAVAETFARETVEGRAAAGFNIVADRLQAFEITGQDGRNILPHLAPSRDVSVRLVPDSAGPDLAVRIDRSFRNAREDLLFEQKLRAFLNIPSGLSIGPISQDEVRRQHPERVLRSGDRMAAPVDMFGDPARQASLRNVRQVRAGAGAASEIARTGDLVSAGQSVIDADRLNIAGRLASTSAGVSGRLSGETMTLSGSLLTGSLTSGVITSSGPIRAVEAQTRSATATGPFSATQLDAVDQINFRRVSTTGLRSQRVNANRLVVEGTLSGPEPRSLQTPVPKVMPGQLLGGQR